MGNKLLVIVLLLFIGKSYAQDYKILPDFEYQYLDGSEFKSSSLESKPLLLVYFNPLCEVCQEEVRELKRSINKMENFQILMISPNKKEDIANFVDVFKLNKFENIKVLFDEKDSFYKTFDSPGYPSLYFYNDKKELITSFKGYTSVDEFSNILKTEISNSSKNSDKKDRQKIN